MTKRIQDIFASRRLKTVFDFTGRFSPNLDETIVPTVVLESFQISDFNRGPVEAFASGTTVVSPVGEPAFAALIPPLGAQIPPIRPYVPVLRVKRIQLFADNDQTLLAKIIPTAIAVGGVYDGVAIWEDRRFSATLPDGFVRENNAVTAFPAGGIEIWRDRFQTAAAQVAEWRPLNLILAPLHTLVLFTGEDNRLLNYNIEWQELDPEQTPAATI